MTQYLNVWMSIVACCCSMFAACGSDGKASDNSKSNSVKTNSNEPIHYLDDGPDPSRRADAGEDRGSAAENANAGRGAGDGDPNVGPMQQSAGAMAPAANGGSQAMDMETDAGESAPEPAPDASANEAGTSSTGQSDANAMVCTQCEMTADSDVALCKETLADCDRLMGSTSSESPARPGSPRAQLCREILECMQSQGCAKRNATDCLCGDDENPNRCFGGSFEAMGGACRDVIAAGCETNKPLELSECFNDATTATGAAVAVVELCDQLACAEQCL